MDERLASYLDEHVTYISAPQQWFLQDTFTMVSNGINNMGADTYFCEALYEAK